jgi:hypothetical protein
VAEIAIGLVGCFTRARGTHTPDGRASVSPVAAQYGAVLIGVQLYERHGFRYIGEQPDLFGTQLLTMAKDVRTD